MEGSFDKIYSKEVIEFVTVATEYCKLMEEAPGLDGKDFTGKMHKLLALVYLKGTLLPEIDSVYEQVNERFVTEEDYNFLRHTIETKLGQYDTFFEVFDPSIHDLDEPITANISENLADIYQDLRDFIELYRIGVDEVMNDAVWECKLNFEENWGQKLTNVMRAMHFIYYNRDIDLDDIGQVDQSGQTPGEINNRNWIINQRQKDFKDKHNDIS